jgi:hypothetical protein
MMKNKYLVLASVILMLASCAKDEELTGTGDRDKFLGTWNISANGSVSGPLSYTIDIVAGVSSPSQVAMKNFDFQGSGTTVFGDVDGNTLAIGPDPQIVNGDTLDGSGTYNNNVVTFQYTVRDGLTTDVVTATGTR